MFTIVQMTLEEDINILRGKKEEWNDKDDDTFNQYQTLQDYKREAEKLAIKEFYLQKERLKIKAGLNTKIFTADLEEMEQLKDKLKEQKRSQDTKYALFITVNPKQNDLSGYEELNKKVEKCMAKYWVTDYAYCYEQRSTDTNSIHGLHCHILLTRGSHKPSHCEREIISTFSPLSGNVKQINIQYKKKEWISDKLKYMTGDKTGDGKDEKIPVDVYMREQLGIPPINVRGYEELFSNL